MEVRYCSHCGEQLILKEIGDEGLIPFCNQCSIPYFNSPTPCIITIVINEMNEIILLKQNYVSSIHHVLVAGFIKKGESAEECMVREVSEETGLKVEEFKLFKTLFHEKKNLLMIGFVAKVKKTNLSLSSEVDEAIWVPLNQALDYLRKDSTAYILLSDYMSDLLSKEVEVRI